MAKTSWKRRNLRKLIEKEEGVTVTATNPSKMRLCASLTMSDADIVGEAQKIQPLTEPVKWRVGGNEHKMGDALPQYQPCSIYKNHFHVTVRAKREGSDGDKTEKDN